MVIKQKSHNFDIAVVSVVLVAAALTWALSRSYALIQPGDINLSQSINRTRPESTTVASTPSLADIQAMQMTTFHQQLQSTLDKFVADEPNNYGLVVKHLASGETVAAGSEETIITASLYKTLAAVFALRLVDDQQANLNEILPGSDGRTLQQCIWDSITVSDNPCGHALLTRTNLATTDGLAKLHGLGYKHTDLRGDYPVTTASDTAALFEDIYRQKLLSIKSNQLLLDALLAQKVNNRLPAGLPLGSKIAHKTGDLEGAAHDAGIVYSPGGDYIIVIMSQPGGSSRSLGERYQRMAELTSMVHTIMLTAPQLEAAT